MNTQITIRGRYGKSKVIQTISFDASRFGPFDKIRTNKYKGFPEYYIYIDGEDRKITFADEEEMLSFVVQRKKTTQVATVSINLTGIEKVKAQFIDANEWAMYKDPNNCTLFKQTTYMFDLPRIG